MNLKGIDGLTPLMAATVKGDRPTMAVLLAAGEERRWSL